MAHKIDDAVMESTPTTGTGPLALAAAEPGHKRFADVLGIGDTTYYAVAAYNASGQRTGEWETGVGTYSAANTLTRTTVIRSSNANAAVNFGAGTKLVYITVPAAKMVALDVAGNIAVPGSVVSGADLVMTGDQFLRSSNGASPVSAGFLVRGSAYEMQPWFGGASYGTWNANGLNINGSFTNDSYGLTLNQPGFGYWLGHGGVRRAGMYQDDGNVRIRANNQDKFLLSGDALTIGTRLDINVSAPTQLAANVVNTSTTGYGLLVRTAATDGSFALGVRNRTDTETSFVVQENGAMGALQGNFLYGVAMPNNTGVIYLRNAAGVEQRALLRATDQFLFGDVDNVAPNSYVTLCANLSQRVVINGVEVGLWSAGGLTVSGLLNLGDYTNGTEPAAVAGCIYYNTTIGKAKLGGAGGWETITSV